MDTLPNAFLVQRLEPPLAGGTCDLILDTDCANEIDDQFALTWALLAPDRLNLKGVLAAPFQHHACPDPRTGMERSLQEICHILSLCGRTEVPAVAGSSAWLTGPHQPDSEQLRKIPAVEFLIGTAKAQPADRPLYVAAIGAATNVAAAIMVEPAIREKMVVIWLGGNYWHTASAREFNLEGDPAASRLLLDCGVPLLQVTCSGVAENLRTTLPEVQAYVQPHGAIGAYLAEIFARFQPHRPGASKVIWDLATIAWLMNPDWVPSVLMPAPRLTGDFTWSTDTGRHLMRQATAVARDEVFGDLFRRLSSPPSC